MVKVIVAIALLLLTTPLGTGAGPGRGPGPEPMPKPIQGEWKAWLEEQPGVELLPPDTFMTIEWTERHVVHADDEAAARALLDAIKAKAPKEKEGSVVVDIVIGPDDARSALRFVPHQTDDAAVDLLFEPLPPTAHLRLVGYHEEEVGDPHHQGPQEFESARSVRLYADDVVAAGLEVTAPDGFFVGVETGEYGRQVGEDPVDGGAALGDPENRYDDGTDAASVRAMAKAYQQAKTLPVGPKSVNGTRMAFPDRQSAISAAKALPEDMPLEIWSRGGGPDFDLPPAHEFGAGSPSRMELVEWAAANPVAKIAHYSHLQLEYDDPADCDAFLANPPAWTGAIGLSCEEEGGGSWSAAGTVQELPEFAAKSATVVADGGHLTHFGGGRTYLSAGKDLEAQIRMVRAFGWEGTRNIDLSGFPDDKGRTSNIKFLSTATGEATDIDGVVQNERKQLIDAWNASAN